MILITRQKQIFALELNSATSAYPDERINWAFVPAKAKEAIAVNNPNRSFSDVLDVQL